MLYIDGSYGEGGGQILRTAVSLSVLTNTPIMVDHIRSNRSNPGLRPQHQLALSVMKELSNAETKGLTVGSSKIEFIPHDLKPGSYEFDIGTAGSMVLVFQTILLGVLHTKQSVRITLHGGSDVKWSPSWDYFEHVFLPVISQMGVSVSARLHQRGYYPKGGGEAELSIEPIKNELSPLIFESFHPKHVYGQVHLAHLPDHIAKRMKHTVMKKAVPYDLVANIQTERGESLSPGVGLTLWTDEDGGKFGSVSLGEKGVPAETVGENAIDSIIADVSSGATVDLWLSDQILPYLALASEHSLFRVRKLTGHCKTNMWVLKRFFENIDFSIIEEKDCVMVSCEMD